MLGELETYCMFQLGWGEGEGNVGMGFGWSDGVLFRNKFWPGACSLVMRFGLGRWKRGFFLCFFWSLLLCARWDGLDAWLLHRRLRDLERFGRRCGCCFAIFPIWRSRIGNVGCQCKERSFPDLDLLRASMILRTKKG